jgi:SAM-dependent methyltransferase
MPRLPLELTDCPACGATAARTVADADAIRAELESLWGFHQRRLRPETPPERLADRVAFSQPPALAIACCERCGMLYRRPRERAWLVTALYAAERPDDDVLQALFDVQRPAYQAQLARLARVLGHAGRVLEVGSHVGGFLAAAADAGWQAEGVDVKAAAVAFARGRGLRTTEGDLEAVDDARPFDVVAMWTCFDQLPEPRAAAHRARELVRDGGVLVVRVPNGGFWLRTRARLAGPGAAVARLALAHNNLLGFPYRHGFTLGALERVLGATGWRIERVVGDTLVPIADEWTRGWAAWEERVAKGVLRAVGRARPEAAPWLEVYARGV